MKWVNVYKKYNISQHLLFNATSRYTVTQTGTAQINLGSLFDGKMLPSYSSAGLLESDQNWINNGTIGAKEVKVEITSQFDRKLPRNLPLRIKFTVVCKSRVIRIKIKQFAWIKYFT